MSQVVTLKKNLLNTKDMEKWMLRIKEDIIRYRKVENSEELKAFRALQSIVETKAFQDNKQYLLKRKYRQTDEYKQTRRFHILRHYTPRVIGYLLYARNTDLHDYIEFTHTDAYSLLQDKEAISASATLQKYKRIGNSFAWKRYQKLEQSNEVQEYLALRDIIETDDFQQRKAFWSNPKRWYTTPESQQDAQYTALKQSDDIRFFMAQNPAQIAEWERYKLSMNEDFEGTTWQNGQWDAGFYYANPNLKTDHSYDNEQQANHQGKNTSVDNSTLRIETRKEKATASAWHPVKGFIQKTYHYTGDILQAGQHFQQAEGVFMAKVRFSGKTHAAVFLGTGTRLPLLSLIQWNGKSMGVGMGTEKGVARTEIGNLKPNKWMIYSVVIQKKDIVWYINDQEVMRQPNTLNGDSFYPAITTFLPQQAKAGVGKVEVDWVKVYTVDF